MCPWTLWQPATLKFCEALLCGPIRQPANTASNIGFVIVGLLILWRERQGAWSPYHIMGMASVVLGFTSGAFHASMTFFWQFFDVSSMFMLILLALSFNLVRLKLIKQEHYAWAYLAMLAVSMLTMLIAQGKSGEVVFAIEVAMVVALEALIYRRGGRPNYQGILRAIGTFLFAFLIWNGDIHGWWCDPDNHVLQGHAAWHLLCALAIWFMYQFYLQFDARGKKP